MNCGSEGLGSIFRRKDGRWVGHVQDDAGRRFRFYGKTQREVRERLTTIKRELQQGIAQVRREFETVVELNEQLGHHVQNAQKKFDETRRALGRASGAIEGLAQVPPAGGDQGVLPLHVNNEPD